MELPSPGPDWDLLAVIRTSPDRAEPMTWVYQHRVTRVLRFEAPGPVLLIPPSTLAAILAMTH